MTFDYKDSSTWREKYPSCRLPNQSPININTDGTVSIPYCKLRCAIDFIYKAGPNTKNHLGKFLDMFRSKFCVSLGYIKIFNIIIFC